MFHPIGISVPLHNGVITNDNRYSCHHNKKMKNFVVTTKRRVWVGAARSEYYGPYELK
jgi:hypothetical protein